MKQELLELLFALLKSGITGNMLSDDIKSIYSDGYLDELIQLSSKYDMAHLMVLGLKNNGFLTDDDSRFDNYIFSAVYRYEQLAYEFGQICSALEEAGIPYIPLKGSILRNYYPEPWMRTSCDIDILVKKDNLDEAVRCLVEKLQYSNKKRDSHDISLYSPSQVHIELHYDLVEEGRANHASDILITVWENVTLHEKKNYWYDMNDEFFYFYHIAHMAKHFESGGCGVRPFVDLWVLDRVNVPESCQREKLLIRGGLHRFAVISQRLSRIWMENEPSDELCKSMQEYVFSGGIYGTAENRVAIQQKRKGGRLGYLLSRVFVPYSKLKRYYPILEKHRWLTPIMQVRRWCMVWSPDIARIAKSEILHNRRVDNDKTSRLNELLDNLGL